jgi:endoglucanase
MTVKPFPRARLFWLAPGLLLPLACSCSREAPPASWLESPGSSGTVGKASVATTPDVRASGPFVSCENAPVNPLIRVDQFGYRPEGKKLAVLVDPVTGWNENEQLKPGAVYEVRSWADGKLAFSGAPQPWNNGSVQPSSGDRGFWFDFSVLSTDGSYCIVDKERGFRSHRFEINRQVYRDVLKAATRMFYFQRANVAKLRPHACVKEKCWTASADYVGAGQDREARSVTDRGNAKTARDLSGGWWDAGDTNKYVTFAQVVLHQLLTAYSERPKAFGDDFGIPESNNAVPDILDELKVELDWLRRMQPSDLGGGVLIKVGNVEHGDPITRPWSCATLSPSRATPMT